ncbi:HAD-IIB family hydrolase [Mesobacillus zeae]|uniref:HAD-IIB family hydrolase n=1 Tax=Mesobacillus zeae TaxID=1917180 RepID=A0A398AXW0_9BACI|nr:HAD-IIB family hydrolase [Mesobacillus zeae]RID81578.1 HAD-IIB family hydrolase [Mesobacillus zeae]
MLLKFKNSHKLLPYVEKPKYMVFCDFDETYYPHNMTDERRRHLHELEDYLEKQSNEGKLVIGWVTGSSIDSLLAKMEKGGLRFFPHFIASDLGTEITYFSDERFGEQDSEWHSRIDGGDFSIKKIEKIVDFLHKDNNIFLNPQTQLGSSRYKRNFYYQEQNESADMENLAHIKTVSEQNRMLVNVNRCNPLAGDPGDSYDIDFIPLGTGKDEIVRFMLKKYGLQPEHAFAFGDSGNDLRMLRAVKNGYLVANATKEAKNAHPKLAPEGYSKGIMAILECFIG